LSLFEKIPLGTSAAVISGLYFGIFFQFFDQFSFAYGYFFSFSFMLGFDQSYIFNIIFSLLFLIVFGLSFFITLDNVSLKMRNIIGEICQTFEPDVSIDTVNGYVSC
jgi:hypothetical protein